MKMTRNKRWCLTALLAASAMVYTASSFAQTDKLVIESGDSAQSRQQAAMERAVERYPLATAEGE